MEIKQMSRYRASDLASSAYENLFAFTFSTEHSNGIAVMRPDGTGYRELVEDYGMYPSLSPDGKHLAYWHYYSKRGLAIYNLEEVRFERVFTQYQPDGNMAWSPNSRYLAYVTQKDSDSGKEYLAVLDLLAARVILATSATSGPVSWASNTEVYYRLNSSSYAAFNLETNQKVTTDGRTPIWSLYGDSAAVQPKLIRVVTRNKRTHLFRMSNVTHLVWSPDGTKLLIYGYRRFKRGLHLFDLKTLKVQLLVGSKVYSGVAHSPVISLDNTVVAY